MSDRSRSFAYETVRDQLEVDGDLAEPVTHVSRQRVSDYERLEYLAGMIVELRDMAQRIPHSCLPAILESALVETRLQIERNELSSLR